ncbi:G-protein coupled receptor moody [Nilaparvata lugens]|uniref:G-protein coupled receptor moody n=1 Tax=Nilaparvata lugens TaxID=108931 RepID=UPI00193CAFC7|nr:G-protein coupled receptor moody [Nilaparvata lugens]
MRYGLLAVSLFTVLAITINRYVMIGHPTLYPKLYRRQYLGMMVACTWVSGFGALVATWLGRWGRFGLDQQIGSCSILPDAQGRSPKQFLFMVAFVIPCICIVVCYAKIFYIVRRTAMKSRLTNNARNNNVAVGYPMPTSSTTSSSALNSASTNFTTASNRPGGLFSKNSSGFAAYYTRGSGRSKLLRKNRRPSYSIGEDSAVGSSSTEAPSFSTTEKSSSLTENGNSTSTTTTTYDIIPVIRMVTIQTDLPDPHLLSPNKSVVLPDVSSSSGIENPLGDDERDAVLSRSVTPTSMCGSSHPASPTPSRRRSINRKRYRKERLPSAVVTTTLSHIGAVFRRSSQLSRSPRRPSSAAPPTPGKMTAKDRKLLKMILVIFASFVTCYLPITVSKTTFRHNSMETRWLNIAGYILIYLTTCINPIIYVVMSSEYRQAYKNLLMCRTGDSSSHNNGAHGHNNQPHNNNKNRG